MDEAQPSRSRWRRPARLAALLGLLATSLVAWLGVPQAVHQGLWAVQAQASPTLPTVVLVVLDNVRADQTSLCGSSLPTTPALDRLAHRPDASFTCKAIAPGAWTLPSHASYFTGLWPWEHRADWADQASHVLAFDVRPLAPEVTSLAELHKQRGRATVMIAGNPLLGAGAGLEQGFDTVVAAKTYYEGRGDWIDTSLREVLARPAVRDAAGLFLVVNIFDAHDVWAAVPAGLGWLPAQPQADYGAGDQGGATRLLRRELPEPERTLWLRQIRQGYQYGVYTEDRSLDAVLAALDQAGWTAPGLQLVVTSDHGEMLGEHDAVSHGAFVFQATQQVPLVTVGLGDCSGGGGWISSIVTYRALADGRCPDQSPEASSYVPPQRHFDQQSAGRWGHVARFAAWQGDAQVELDGEELHAWRAGTGESEPLDAAPAHLLQRIARIRTTLEQQPSPTQIASPATQAALKALGYVQ